jgi:hypothetical protein
MGSIYQTVFGGHLVAPALPTYLALNISANTVLGWPLESNITSPAAAEIIDVTATAPGLTIQLSDARQVGTGYCALFNNVGGNTFTLLDAQGNTLMAPAPGAAWQIYLADNSTLQGTWRVFQYGASVSVANAAALAGAGLKAISATLNEQILINAQAVNYTIGSGTNQDRASCVEWTGGSGGTFTTSTAPTLGTGWFCYIKNGGTGVLTLTPGSGTINGSASMTFNPNDSAIIATDGTNFFSIGFGQSVASSFNFVTISLAGASGNVTLAGAQLNRISYKFTGALAGNTTVIVPASIQQYWVDNETTGAFTLTISAGGAGATFVVPQANRVILYCDGLNIVNAVSAGTGGTTLVADGSAAAPGLTWASDTQMGLYKAGVDTLAFSTAGTARGNINAVGQWTLNAPTSGNALIVNGAAAAVAIFAGSGSSSGISISRTGTTVGDVGSGDFAVGGNAADFGVTSRAGALVLGTNSTTRVVVANAGSVTINAPTTGNNSLTATAVANSYAGRFNGASTSGQSNGIQIVAGTTSGDLALDIRNQAVTANLFQLWGDGHFNLGPTLTGTAAGNVSVAAPSSGVGLTVTGVGGSYAVQVLSGSSGVENGVIINAGAVITDTAFLIQNRAGSVNFFGVSGIGGVSMGPGNNSLLVSGTTGGVTINAPSSGSALVVTGIANSYVAQIDASSTAGQSFGLAVTGGTNSSDVAFLIQNASAVARFEVRGDGAIFAGGASGTAFQIATTGAASVAAPSSGNAFTITSVANANGLVVNAPNTASQSFGEIIQAGTNSSDYSFRVNNAATTTTYFQVRGDGVVQGNDGTSLFELGYKDTPLSIQSGNYTLVASDRGKTIAFTANGLTATLNTGVFSAGAVISLLIGPGNSLTVAQGAGVTLQWVGNGSTTGSRTLTGAGLATVLWASGTQAYITGGGLS